MKILIAEDDLASRLFLYKFMSQYGECDQTVDGLEALDAVVLAHEEGAPYDLICLDIMMPKLDGLKAHKAIRELEKMRKVQGSERAKILVTTALHTDYLAETFQSELEQYTSKPLDTAVLTEMLRKLQLVT